MAKTKTTKKKPASKTAGMSDVAVRAKTGKTWPQWIKVLDAAGCRNMNHKEIVAVLTQKHRKMGGWWIQMVTVGYEQARGLREKHQKPGGYEIGVSKTIAVSVSKAFDAWRDARTRNRWLPGEAIEIRKATRNKSMRITWSDQKTSVDANFYAKGAGKCQIAVQHRKLTNARQAAAKKAFWAKALGRLKEILEA